MRIFMSAIGSLGDVNPIITLGRALTRRNHDVYVLATGDAKEKIEAGGLKTHVVLSQEAYDAWRRMPRETDPGMESVKALVNVAFPALEETIRFAWRNQIPGATISLAPPMAAQGLQYIRELHKVPLIEIQFAPRHDKEPEHFDRTFGEVVNDIRASVGLKPLTHGWMDWLLSCDAIVGLYPDWFLKAVDWDRTLNVIPTQYIFDKKDDDQELPIELQHFLDSGPAPMAVTFGSYASTDSTLYTNVIAYCVAAKQRLVIITRYPDQLPDPLPKCCMTVPYVSLKKLFPCLSAVIHHGGAGTIAQAFRAAIPQLVCPMAFDQFINAERVVGLGCGVVLDRSALSSGQMAHAVSALNEVPDLARNLNSIAGKFEQDESYVGICETIERKANELGVAGAFCG